MWFSITCLPVPRAAEIACLWSWKPSTFSFSLNNYTLILNRKRETLNAGLVKTCLPASLLSQILQLLLSGKPTKTNPLQRVSQERNRTKLTKILGKRDNSGCSFTRQFHLSNHSLLPKWEVLLLLHYLLFLLLAPCSDHLPSVGSGRQQHKELHYLMDCHTRSAPRKVQDVHKQAQEKRWNYTAGSGE